MAREPGYSSCWEGTSSSSPPWKEEPWGYLSACTSIPACPPVAPSLASERFHTDRADSSAPWRWRLHQINIPASRASGASCHRSPSPVRVQGPERPSRRRPLHAAPRGLHQRKERPMLREGRRNRQVHVHNMSPRPHTRLHSYLTRPHSSTRTSHPRTRPSQKGCDARSSCALSTRARRPAALS